MFDADAPKLLIYPGPASEENDASEYSDVDVTMAGTLNAALASCL